MELPEPWVKTQEDELDVGISEAWTNEVAGLYMYTYSHDNSRTLFKLPYGTLATFTSEVLDEAILRFLEGTVNEPLSM